MYLEVFRLRQFANFLAVSIIEKIAAGLAAFGEPDLVQIVPVPGEREVGRKDEIRQAVKNREGLRRAVVHQWIGIIRGGLVVRSGRRKRELAGAFSLYRNNPGRRRRIDARRDGLEIPRSHRRDSFADA